jgi:hypothetical protein
MHGTMTVHLRRRRGPRNRGVLAQQLFLKELMLTKERQRKAYGEQADGSANETHGGGHGGGRAVGQAG